MIKHALIIPTIAFICCLGLGVLLSHMDVFDTLVPVLFGVIGSYVYTIVYNIVKLI